MYLFHVGVRVSVGDGAGSQGAKDLTNVDILIGLTEVNFVISEKVKRCTWVKNIIMTLYGGNWLMYIIMFIYNYVHILCPSKFVYG